MRAVLVGVKTNQTEKEFEFSLAELEGLVEAAEGVVLGKVYQKRDAPDPAYYIGKGKAQEIAKLVEGIKADTVVFNVNLSPVQIMNLQDTIGVQILDRTDLILQIFLKRAKTKQAKLQVELAYLQHQLPRIFQGKGKELSRIGGGMKTRGAGEQIGEIKSRRIRERIARIKREIEEIKKQKHVQMKARQDNPDILKVSLVGYTNAGKSSLLKALSKKDIFVSDMLFATLDTKTSSVYFPDIGKKALITDTVGFVQNMPQELMDAFMATLEEVKDADLILHVMDISDENWEEKKRTVDEVIERLGVKDKPVVEVMNKIDKLVPTVDLIDEPEREDKVYISAEKRWNLDKLVNILKKHATIKAEVARYGK